jgi:hypothetical protein
MKKYLWYIMLALTVFSACKNDAVDPASGERPEERVSAALATYSTLLTGSTNGWKGFLYPQGGGVYLFSMKFGDKNRVTMLSDINTTTSTTNSESSYRLAQQASPSLLFDTYSYIHLLADPDPKANGGIAGQGAYSDFEFYIDKVVGDTVKLIGNRLGSKMDLVKAGSATDYATFTKGTNDVLSKFAQLRTYFRRVTIGGVSCEFKVDAAAKTITFSYLVNGNYTSVTGQFYVDGSTSTMVFLSPITVGTAKITEIKSFTLDATNRVVSATINGDATQFREAITPLKLDLTAAQKWYTQMNMNFNGCWVSDAAFHFGVDDFCGFRNVSGYQNLWYAGAAVFGGTSEGLIAYTGALASPYVLSKTPVTMNAGIARFTLGTNAGTFTGTASLAVAMTSARNILYGGATVNSFQDWYLIPTGADGLHYDMVRVSDAQAWISWRPR